MGQENSPDQTPPPSPTVYQWWADKIRNLPGGGWLFAVLPLLIMGYFGWKNYGAEHLDQTLYALRAENIELTPQPNWIRGDIREEVYANGVLSRVSLLDPQATATIAHAFDSHTWIKNTHRVRKTSGGRVQVDVVYRRPIAMVHYQKVPVLGSQPSGANKKLCYPVDEDGVVLPGDNFASAEVHNYFMIFAPNAEPTGEMGLAFRDERILQALKLCRLLEGQRASLKLDCIYVEPDAMDKNLNGFNSWVLIVTTADKRNIIWGHAPGKESKDEPLVEEKIMAMQGWLQNPSVALAPGQSKTGGSPDLDLRFRQTLGRRLINTNAIPVPEPSGKLRPFGP